MPQNAFLALSRRQWLALTAGAAAGRALAQSPDPFWRLLREGGCVVLMRHAQTEPGLGDPPNFRLGDCRTQRNLSATGREQARRVGAALQRGDIAIAAVRSSAWCRCVDTAQLAFGRHARWTALNSFFQGQGDAKVQTREVLDTVAALRAPVNWVLVTHQVNITALTGEYPAMGELFVTRPDPASPGRLAVLARQVL
ncbi:MAG: histidine phosphatase family protein [Hydrogenophaga sp.]|nr:histidine phosphatase family protein [Hydrogenophaga sp.]